MGVDEKLISMEQRMTKLETLLEENNKALGEFIDLAKAFKFGLKVLGVIESIAVFITKLSLAGGALWGVWKYAIKEALASLK